VRIRTKKQERQRRLKRGTCNVKGEGAGPGERVLDGEAVEVGGGWGGGCAREKVERKGGMAENVRKNRGGGGGVWRGVEREGGGVDLRENDKLEVIGR